MLALENQKWTFINTLKTSEILNVMGFENEKDFFVLKPDEEILSYDDDCVRKNQALCARVCEHIKSEHKNISSLNDDEKYFYLNRKIIEAEPVIPKRVADIISFSASLQTITILSLETPLTIFSAKVISKLKCLI